MATLPPITVFDVETTGLDPKKGHRIIEIAGLRIDNGIVDESGEFYLTCEPRARDSLGSAAREQNKR